MGRRKGSTNKASRPPKEIRLSNEEKLAVLADIFLELACEELGVKPEGLS